MGVWRGCCVLVNVSHSDDEIDGIYTDAHVHLEDYHNSCTPSCIAQRGVESPCFFIPGVPGLLVMLFPGRA